MDESNALHDRVRAFAVASASGDANGFDELAVDIARFQERHHPGYARLVAARGGIGPDADAIPAVPVDAFRVARVAVHSQELDVARFLTSGTTTVRPGAHAFRTLETYSRLALLSGETALSSHAGPRVVVALAPSPGVAPTSSLGFMMRAFMQSWDGRPLEGRGPFDALEPARWLLGSDGVNVEGLTRAASIAGSRGESLLLLATGFALVLLLDALGDRGLSVPAGTVVMPTGGFKGRTREIAPRELVDWLARAFSIPESNIVFEYGMTELSSQLYEETLRPTHAPRERGERGVYVPPPWLRVAAVDPETLAPVTPGAPGIARFVDLANVDSAVAVVTEDLVRQRGRGIELLGRKPGAHSRGCSLAVEELVRGGAIG